MDVTAAGQIAVGAQGGDLTLMTLDSGKPLFALKVPGGTILDVAYSDDGKRLACQTEAQLFLVDVPSYLEDASDPGKGPRKNNMINVCEGEWRSSTRRETPRASSGPGRVLRR